MSVSHRYRNFGSSNRTESSDAPESSDQIEQDKLAAFEAGYQAGWDDSTKAQSDNRDKISSDFARSLQEMSFTYHEALAKLTLSLKPVMSEIVDRLLPAMVAQSLAGHILEQIDALLKDSISQPVEIVVAPKNVEAIKDFADGKIEPPFEVVGDTSVAEGQAFVRIGSEEQEIDISGVVSAISEALNAFFHEAQKEQAND